jgi:multiple antibiotic resistance protein
MLLLYGDLLKSTIALFVVLNPIGTVPLFITITQNLKKEERKAVSKTAALLHKLLSYLSGRSKTAIITSGIVLVVFAIGGTGILRFFLESQYSAL